MGSLALVAGAQLLVLKGRPVELVAVLVVPEIILMMTRMTIIMTKVTSGTKAKNTRTKMKMTMKMMIGDDGDDIDDNVDVTMQKLPRQPPDQ